MNHFQIFGLAWLGGLILNVMPCVLPVLALKVFRLLEHAQQSAQHRRESTLGYTLGIAIVMSVLASVVVLLQSAGARLFQGQQWQHPAFVGVLTWIIFVFSLNALGLFEVRLAVRGSGPKKGLWGAIADGILMAVMATPCTAPFLGATMAYVLGTARPSWEVFVIFNLIGLGLATPFALIASIPSLRRLLPKPGGWMQHFKIHMGFSLLAAALWLWTVFAQQHSDRATSLLGILLLTPILVWNHEYWAPMTAPRRQRQWANLFTLAALLTLPWWGTALSQLATHALAALAGLSVAALFGLLIALASATLLVAGIWDSADWTRSGRWRPLNMLLLSMLLLGNIEAIQKHSQYDAAWLVASVLFALTYLFWATRIVRDDTSSRTVKFIYAAGTTLLVAVVAQPLFFDASGPSQPTSMTSIAVQTSHQGGIAWTPFSEQAIDQIHQNQQAAFLDYTADWCTACKSNEAFILETSEVRSTLTQTGIVPVKVDLTSSDPIAESWLSKLGRSAIPAYAIYLPSGEVMLLPVQISTSVVTEYLQTAAHKLPTQRPH